MVSLDWSIRSGRENRGLGKKLYTKLFFGTFRTSKNKLYSGRPLGYTVVFADRGALEGRDRKTHAPRHILSRPPNRKLPWQRMLSLTPSGAGQRTRTPPPPQEVAFSGGQTCTRSQKHFKKSLRRTASSKLKPKWQAGRMSKTRSDALCGGCGERVGQLQAQRQT